MRLRRSISPPLCLSLQYTWPGASLLAFVSCTFCSQRLLRRRSYTSGRIKKVPVPLLVFALGPTGMNSLTGDWAFVGTTLVSSELTSNAERTHGIVSTSQAGTARQNVTKAEANERDSSALAISLSNGEGQANKVPPLSLSGLRSGCPSDALAYQSEEAANENAASDASCGQDQSKESDMRNATEDGMTSSVLSVLLLATFKILNIGVPRRRLPKSERDELCRRSCGRCTDTGKYGEMREWRIATGPHRF